MMKLPSNTEWLGASAEDLLISGAGTLASVQLTPQGQHRLSTAAAGGATAANTVYLALEHVRGTQDATLLSVYLVPPGPPEAAPPRLLLGGEALYGLRRASNPQGSNRSGLTLVFDLTPKLAELAAYGLPAGSVLHLQISSTPPLPPTSTIIIGRVSLFCLPPG